MKQPHYIGLDEARAVLSEMGIVLKARQMKRATDKDAEGRRRLPFFIDPIDGTLKIEKQALINAYDTRRVNAERSCRPTEP